MILIGSRALLIQAPQFLNRVPKDFDFIATRQEALDFISKYSLPYTENDGKIIANEISLPCEFELIKEGGSNELFEKLVAADPETIKTEFGLVPGVNLLFTLKASHRYLKNSPHFWKTARDYHVLKASGAEILPLYREFFSKREEETYWYKHPKLNVKKAEFFVGDQVEYRWDHDSIHESMKHLERPIYTLFQKDGAQVACDKNKFFALPEQWRLYSVLEESYVLALERSQVPYPGKLSPRQSFLMALSKVCSSITSGWWREYAYEHIFEAVQAYDDTYLDRFNQAIQTGVVKPYDASK